MSKVATYIKSANAGEWSPLLEGRVDLQKYPASLRRAYNVVITPQGPTLRRSGTMKQAPVYDEDDHAYLLPFVFSNDQAMQVEAAHERMRFHAEAGLLARVPTDITVVLSAVGDPFQFTSVHGGAVVGDQLVLAGFDASSNLNGRVANITVVAGNDITVDVLTPVSVGSLATATMAWVYHIVSPYDEADVSMLRYVPDQDTLFLFCDGYYPRKLQRYGAYDWRIAEMDFKDGPYGPTNDTNTKLTPSVATGNLIATMTAAGLPVPLAASASGDDGTNVAWHAFDANPATYWGSNLAQTGTLNLDFGVGTVVDGYTIEAADINNDTSYSSVDYAPGDFTFEGSIDNVTYDLLDSHVGYLLYDGGRSAYFSIKNATAYRYYRLVITKTTRNGALAPRVARLLMTGPSAAAITFTASAATGINQDQGFLATDVGRLFRFLGKDGMWRPFEIASRVSATVITATAKGDPLSTLDPSTSWRLGMFSDTSGYPTCGAFHEDRLCMGGMSGYPDYVIGSVTGKYEVMSQTEPNGNVSDDNALVLKLNARKQGRVMWLSTDIRALLVGTGSSEWAIVSAEQNAALTARTAKAKQGSRRGSANVEPLQIDDNTLFVQRANRTVRNYKYVFEADGYRSPSMSLFASHIGAPQFLQLEYAAEPHALALARRGDGTVAILTFNPEEDVVGWQVFDFNGFVECISVIPAEDGTQDAVWLVVRRTIGGVQRRFVERMTRFWDFNSVLLDAVFCDCASVYEGAAATNIYGLYDYEGARVVGLADGSPITPIEEVEDGMATLVQAASKVVIGLGYDSVVETSRPEAGGDNGTAQGKEKRVVGAKLRLWQSGGGEYAVRNDVGDVTDYLKLEYLTPDVPLGEPPALKTGDTAELDMPQAISTEGTILYRQHGDIPLPFNVVAVMPVISVSPS